jgi:hypothetical protein
VLTDAFVDQIGARDETARNGIDAGGRRHLQARPGFL